MICCEHCDMWCHTKCDGIDEASYRALSEEGRPELSTIFKVMQALGLRLAPVRVDSAA